MSYYRFPTRFSWDSIKALGSVESVQSCPCPGESLRAGGDSKSSYDLVKWEHGRGTGATAKGEPRAARADGGTAWTARAKSKVARAVRWGSPANRGAEKEGERAPCLRQSECEKEAAEQASQEAQARAQ